MAGINLSSAKPTINISNGVSNKELSMGYVGTRDHTKLANLDYENSGHTGFQKELTFDDTPTADSTNPVTSGGVKTELDKKADSGDVYTKSETDTLLSEKADTATTLDGYGITDAYTKEEIGIILESKQDATGFDEYPTQDSEALLTSGSIYNANQEMDNRLSYQISDLELADERLKYYGDKDIVPSDESWFTVSDDGSTITGLSDTGKEQTELVIPYKINGVEITKLGDSAFFGTGLTNVVIPNSVTIIEGAFESCCLTNIDIPNSVRIIDSGAFLDNPLLSNISIPNSVTSIGGIAFMGCVLLAKVIIPRSVTSIGTNAFLYCSDELTIYCEQGSTADTYAKENNIPVVYTDVKATSINPTVKTALDDTISVNTIYDLGVQTALTITLPSGQIGDFIQFDFISGSTATDLSVNPATTLTVNSSSGLVGFDLIPGTNTVYTLYFDWGETGLDGTTVTYGWRFNYSEYSITIA